jgi:hypothetical protein
MPRMVASTLLVQLCITVLWALRPAAAAAAAAAAGCCTARILKTAWLPTLAAAAAALQAYSLLPVCQQHYAPARTHPLPSLNLSMWLKLAGDCTQRAVHTSNTTQHTVLYTALPHTRACSHNLGLLARQGMEHSRHHMPHLWVRDVMPGCAHPLTARSPETMFAYRAPQGSHQHTQTTNKYTNKHTYMSRSKT